MHPPAPSTRSAATSPPIRRPGADAAQPAGPPRQRVLGEPGPLPGRVAHRAAHPAEQRPDPRPAPAEPPEDGPWSLVRSAQAGDMTAFSELFDRYYDVVFRYVLFRMNDRTLAEDITQETFLRALRRIASVTYQGRDIGAWFVTIARNLIFDHVKSSRYRLESTTSDIVELSPSTHGPEQQVLDLRDERGAAAVRPQAQRGPAGVHLPAVPAGPVRRRDGEDHGPQRGGGEGTAAQSGP